MEKISEQDILHGLEIFGNWVNDPPAVEEKPFKHVIIDDFLSEDAFSAIKFVEPSSDWWKYINPLEVKYTFDDIARFPKPIKDVFFSLSGDSIIEILSNMFGIPDLQKDPYCHGGGLHLHPRNGRLAMHLDYEKHPFIEKQRQLNIILYCNDVWKEEWKGETVLSGGNLLIKSLPKRNSAIIFVTNEESLHGVPEKIACPSGLYRKTIAFYYLSELKNDPSPLKIGAEADGYRHRAVFISDTSDPRLRQLIKIRPFRRITNEDMSAIWPEWTPEAN